MGGWIMRIHQKTCLTFVATFLAVLAASNAKAVTYQYVSTPLTADFGTALAGHPIIFDFSTYNILPANLSDVQNLSAPAFSVPVIDWFVSVGPYQTSGAGPPTRSGGLVFLVFDTNSVHAITGSSFVESAPTSDGHQITVSESVAGGIGSIFGLVSDFVQINPNVNDTYSDIGTATVPGAWTLLDPTIIAAPIPPVPEPSTWAMLLLGFAAIGFVGYRRSRSARRSGNRKSQIIDVAQCIALSWSGRYRQHSVCGNAAGQLNRVGTANLN
jgi:hypothetical protein